MAYEEKEEKARAPHDDDEDEQKAIKDIEEKALKAIMADTGSDNAEKGMEGMAGQEASGDGEKAKKGMPPAFLAAIREKQKKKDGESDGDEKAKKSDDKDEDDAKKSLDSATLRKSLDALESIVKSSPEARKQNLLRKAMDSRLDAGEKRELLSLMSDERPTSDFSKSVDSLRRESNEDLAKSLDVSDYLDELHNSIVESTASLAKAMESNTTRQDEFQLVLAKGVLDAGRAIESVADRLTSLEKSVQGFGRAPASAPRGVAPQGQSTQRRMPTETLSKSQVLDAMEEFQKSVRGGITETGVNVLTEISRYEQSGRMSEAMKDELARFMSSSAKRN